MLWKLSLSSMRKMMKDYLVLLVGLVISISIFYMFQTLGMNSEYVKANSMIRSIGIVFNVGAFLLAFITIFYIFYANSFLLSLRRKELGMYMVLGAKKARISQMLFGETLLMGVVSLVIGSLVGIVLSSGIGQLLMSLLDISTEGYHPFYLPSLLMTWGFFLVLFLITSTINAIRLARATELDLIRAEQQNDKVKAKGVGTIVVAILGISLVAFGYYLLTHLREYVALGFIVGAVVTTIGTYLIFISLLPVFVQMLKNNKKLNDRQLNAFTFAQLRFRVNNLTKILGTVAMLIALGVGAMAGGLAFQQNVELVASIGRIYDITLHDPVEEDYQALANMQVLEQNTYRYKKDEKAYYFTKEDLLAHPPLISTNTMEQYSPDNEPKRVTQPLPEKAYIMYNDPAEDPQLAAVPDEWSQAISREFISSYEMLSDHAVQIVDQETYAAIKGSEHKLLVAQVDDYLKYKADLKAMDERQMKLLKPEHVDEDHEVSINSKYSTYQQVYAFTSGTMFMGFFLGIAFLAMMASCLMFKILSGATRDKDRYSMLRKIGVRKELLVGSIYKELFVVFVFPALLGLLHVLVGMEMFSIILLDPYVNIWIPTVIFVAVYAIYYLVTVQLYRGIVLPKEV
ncbi:ABC transporter permease [Brevibacillus agri]|uniref:ABC transporter permease n=1 Tax=Brevibacillus agri TaxID=51101 RepID=UPI001EE5B523|nr:ABC transporter permease [Brevibacillus agri]MCG5253378.1 ABC transporter permease [Brevibacillus agri]MED1642834.1 ABC transporter permease [Brevibacillus agri]MED1653710.1 ABC transporter permease [Brevibacillus agri]MED1688621.1 ABC transporter permease [Brevibacillus agri]MED1700237.1 ABC transporter permease [Brevibacillus agri]